MFDHTKYKPFTTIDIKDRTWPDQVISEAPRWCSVDLRDGNQALIEPMSVEQKKKMFALLVEVGFKEIEVGFPAASQPDFDFVRYLIEENKIPSDVTIQVLTQARPELIQRTFESLKGARQAILHVYNSTSVVQREKVFKTDKAGIIAIAKAGAVEVQRCASLAPETDWIFQYSPESFTGTEIDFAVEVCDAVADVWQPTPDKQIIFNLPSTVEVSTPNVYADQIEWFCRHIKNRDSIVVSLHTHNDRACAVGSAELAVMAGAQRVEGTLLGNGERTGNMDIVIMAMNLYSQGVDPKLDLSDMDNIVSVVRECTQIDVHPRQPYLPIDPRDLGRTYQDVIRVNSQSGKGGVAYVLANKFGFELPRWLQIEFSRVVQSVTEQSGGEIQPDSIWRLFNEHYLQSEKIASLEDFSIQKNQGRETFSAMLDLSGKPVEIKGEGDGVLDAFIEGLKRALNIDFEVMEYGEHALGKGSDAEAVTYMQLKFGVRRFSGVAVSKDIISSSLNALMGAVSELLKETAADTSVSAERAAS
jgi:2-isopropylmalate synthase